MEETNLVGEAVKFMILGMGIVYLFLTIMIFALKLQAKLIAKFFPEENKTTIAKKEVKTTESEDSAIIAAITAAIIHHNNKG